MPTPNRYDTYENVLSSKLKGIDPVTVTQRSVIDKMVKDYITGEPKANSEFTVFIKKIVKDGDRSICNVDPFYSTQDDKERMTEGTIKSRKKRIAAYVEIPSFFIGLAMGFVPSSEVLSFNNYSASKKLSAWNKASAPSPFPLLRMDVTNAKSLGGREVLVNEVVIIKFKDQNNFRDPEFVRYPKGKTPVLTDSPSQAGKSRKRGKNFHKVRIAHAFAGLTEGGLAAATRLGNPVEVQEKRATILGGCKSGEFFDSVLRQCLPGKPAGQDINPDLVPEEAAEKEC